MSITVDNTAVKRIEELRTLQNKPDLVLRITVEGGGCSGFQYSFSLTEEVSDSDRVYNKSVVTDPISLEFLDGSKISFENTLIGSDFKIENPNAVSGCGCGTSFAV